MKYLVALLLLLSAITPHASAQCVKAALTKSKSKVKLALVAPAAGGLCPKGSIPFGTSIQGVQGPQGPQGAAGPQGPAGPSAYEPIPSGKTVRGVIGFDREMKVDEYNYLYGSFQSTAPVAVPSEKVVIKATPALLFACGNNTNCLVAADRASSAQSQCPGTAEIPLAAPGYVCIYPTVLTNPGTDGLEGVALEGGNVRVGFAMYFWAPVKGRQYFEATWAYTAP